MQSATPPADVLTEEHRAAITAAIPAGVAAGPEFWTELEEILIGFQRMRARRERYDVNAERRWWRRFEKVIVAGGSRLGESYVSTHERKVKAYAAYHETWRAFSGTKNPYRAFLYGGVLDLWTYRLGGELKYSTAVDGLPSGPLVRFFHACVWPVLGDETPVAGLADIVDREREARDHARRKEPL